MPHHARTMPREYLKTIVNPKYASVRPVLDWGIAGANDIGHKIAESSQFVFMVSMKDA
jgi:hypothetical protein